MQLSEEEIVEIYGTRHIGRDQARRLVGLMDFFCFSEVGLSVIVLFVCMGSLSPLRFVSSIDIGSGMGMAPSLHLISM